MEFLKKENLSKTIINFRAISILVSLAFFVILLRGASNLIFNPDMDTFFPQSHPATSLNTLIDETFIPTDNIIIAVNSKNDSIFTKENLSAIEKLTEKSWTVPYSVRVDSLTNYSYIRSVDDDLLVEPFIEDALNLEESYIEERKNLVNQQEVIFGSLISEDKKTSVISIIVDPTQPNKELKVEELIEYIVSFLEEVKSENPNLDIRLLGNPYQEYISPKLIQAEMPVVLPTMLALIFLSVFFMLRSYFAVLATVLVVFMSVSATFGAIGHLGNPLNQMVVTIPILVITLALADCVHLFSIFFQKRAAGLSSKESMTKSLELNLQPLFLTTLTTCIGFLSFNVLDVVPLVDLGNGVAIGIALAFTFTILFIAPLFSFFEINAPKATRQQVNVSRKIAEFSLVNGKTLIWLVPLISLTLISFIPLSELNENPTQMYSDNFTSFGSDTLWLDEKLGVTFPVSFKANSKTGSVADPEFLKTIEDFSLWLEAQEEVNHVTSLAHTMKNLNTILKILLLIKLKITI